MIAQCGEHVDTRVYSVSSHGKSRGNESTCSSSYHQVEESGDGDMPAEDMFYGSKNFQLDNATDAAAVQREHANSSSNRLEFDYDWLGPHRRFAVQRAAGHDDRILLLFAIGLDTSCAQNMATR